MYHNLKYVHLYYITFELKKQTFKYFYTNNELFDQYYFDVDAYSENWFESDFDVCRHIFKITNNNNNWTI